MYYIINLIIYFTTGFLLFLYNLYKTEGVFFRPDSNGKIRFTLRNLWLILLIPLNIRSNQFLLLWSIIPGITHFDRLNFLEINWIFMSFGCMIFGYILEKILLIQLFDLSYLFIFYLFN